MLLSTTWLQMNLPEWIAAFLGFWCVYLTAKENIFNWPVAFISTIIYAFVFYDTGFYSDAGLQLIFCGFQMYGFYQWSRKQVAGKKAIRYMPTMSFSWLLLLSVAIMPFWYWGLIGLKPDASLPMFDTITAVWSIFAITLQAEKVIQSWWLWFAADLIYIPMYVSKQLYATAVLYALFLVLAIYGLNNWKKLINTNNIISQ